MYNSANNLVLAQQSQTSIEQSFNNAKQNVNNLQSFINSGSNAILVYQLNI